MKRTLTRAAVRRWSRQHAAEYLGLAAARDANR
jgi:hypothetical protein